MEQNGQESDEETENDLNTAYCEFFKRTQQLKKSESTCKSSSVNLIVDYEALEQIVRNFKNGVEDQTLGNNNLVKSFIFDPILSTEEEKFMEFSVKQQEENQTMIPNFDELLQ